jgi:hypothetical protein
MRKNWQTLASAGLTLALVVVLAGAMPSMAGQSYLEDALSALQTAKRELARGPVDKSGHRTKAVRHIDEAITEIKKTMKYEETHAAPEKKPGHAGKPGHVNLSDLVGMRASSLDAEMNARGFVSKGGFQRANAAYSTWWNASTEQCVFVTTKQGRVHEVKATSEADCR